MNNARQEYYTVSVHESSTDKKKLFSLIKSLLSMKKSVVELPPHIDTGTFVNDLGSYFDQKVMKICDRIHSGLGEQCSTRNVPSDNSNAGLQHIFCQFKSLVENDVKNLVMKSNKKTCGSDPMATKFVVDCLGLTCSLECDRGVTCIQPNRAHFIKPVFA